METETTLGEFRAYKDIEEYEVWDEINQKWTSYSESEYSKNEFPVAEEANHPINLITFYNSLKGEYHTFGLNNDYTPKAPNVIYYKCSTEENLLNKFLEIWSEEYPDIVTGWNSDGFDVPYIINRITKMLGEESAKKLSPVGNIYFKENVSKKFGEKIGKWIITGINCIDYLEIYQTFTREKREQYKLGFIGNFELQEGKLAYNAVSLANLSMTDWPSFVDYNIQDVNLLIKLEEKLRYIKTMRIISHKGFCNMEDTLGKVTVVNGAIAAQALKRDRILSTFINDKMDEYDGGFVKEIEPGIIEDVVTFDANSLYPNTIITLNTSPETKIGKVMSIDNDKDEVHIRLVNGKTHILSKANFLGFISKEKIAISKSRVLFSQKTKGIVPEYVDALYGERVKNQKAKDTVEKSLGKCKKGSDEYIENVRKIEQLDILQYTQKILLNSIYGVFGNQYSAICDLDCAESITLTGQAVIKKASNILDDYAKDKYGIIQPITHYNDTDSVVGDTIIRTSKGAILIKDLYDTYKHNTITSASGHKLAIPTDNITCTSIDKQNKPVFTKIKYISKHRTVKKLYKITLKNGKTITTTADHTCIVIQNDNIIQKPATELKLQEKMICFT
jgi:DNA polymerase elongation subunit (family B)